MAIVARFPLGQTVATPGALAALADANVTPATLLDRHVQGDWGEVPPGDAQENAFSLQHGYRIISAYTLSTDVRVWLITEADRSATTMLLPEEY